MTDECPECGEDFVRLVESDGGTVGFACYACSILWFGVTGMELRESHPDAETPAQATLTTGGAR